MSYSRWFNSKWYTFWDVAKARIKIKDEQMFTICSVRSFTYAELKKDLDWCVKVVDGDFELKGYMKEFINDIENDEDYKIRVLGVFPKED